MMKWLLTLAITVVVAGVCMPRLGAWLRLTRLPGDVTVRIAGRETHLPFGSVLVLSLIATALFRWL